MNSFPSLKTGAVMQYPAHKSVSFSTQVVRFVDGSEQRFREFVQPLHRWTIALDLLDETEMNALREFFRIQNGGAEPFTFTDPWDGAVYQSCSLDSDVMVETVTSHNRAKTTLMVKENRT